MFRALFTPKEEIPKSVYAGAGIAAFLLLLGVWFFLTFNQFVNPLFLPSIDRVIQSGISMFAEGGLVNDIAISFSRVLFGFLLAAVIGVPLGILMGTLKIAEGAFEPIIGFIRYMPASAFIPLLILWIGLGEMEKIMVIFLGTFFQLTLMVMDVTKNVERDLIDVSYTLGASRRQLFRKVILPASMPGIVDTLRITFGWAWTYLVVAEIVGASSGIGYMIMQSSRFLKPDKIIVGILIIGILGMAMDYLFKTIYRMSFTWMKRGGS